MKLFRPLGVAALAGAAVLTPTVGSAQTAPPGSAPLLTVDRTPVDPGDTITLTLTGCDVRPRIVAEILQEGIPGLAELDVTGSAPTWTATYTAQQSDLSAYGICDGSFSDRVPVDIDFPRISFTPIGNTPIRFAGAPTMVYGTDCPPGTAAQVRVDITNPDGNGAGDSDRFEVAIDDNGDWETAIPIAEPGQTVTVNASCGDVVYDPLVAVVAGESSVPPPTPPLEPPIVDPPPPTPPPASPRPGSPSFTG